MADATFDGDNLVITLPADSTIVVGRDLYSAWKRWVKTPGNAKYPLAFRTIAGDDISPSLIAAPYFFIQNQSGWRIRPAEQDGTYNFEDSLVGQDTTLPIIIPTIGNFRVLILGLQPITQGADAILTTAQDTNAKAKDIWQNDGLDIANPLTITQNDRKAGDVDLALTGDQVTTTTVTRQP